MDGPPPAVPATGRWSSSAPWWTPCVALSKSRTPWSSATRASAGRGRRERVERTRTFGRLPFRQLPGQEFEDGHFGNDELRALPHKHPCLLSRACRKSASPDLQRTDETVHLAVSGRRPSRALQKRGTAFQIDHWTIIIMQRSSDRIGPSHFYSWRHTRNDPCGVRAFQRRRGKRKPPRICTIGLCVALDALSKFD